MAHGPLAFCFKEIVSCIHGEKILKWTQKLFENAKNCYIFVARERGGVCIVVNINYMIPSHHAVRSLKIRNFIDSTIGFELFVLNCVLQTRKLMF